MPGRKDWSCSLVKELVLQVPGGGQDWEQEQGHHLQPGAQAQASHLQDSQAWINILVQYFLQDLYSQVGTLNNNKFLIRGLTIVNNKARVSN